MRADEFPPYPHSDKFPWDHLDPNGDKRKKALVKHYCWHYAYQLQADDEEITATNLAEYAADQLFEHGGYTDHVYDFLDDPEHWIWDIALEAQEKFA